MDLEKGNPNNSAWQYYHSARNPKNEPYIGVIKCFSKETYRNDFINGKIYFKESGYFRKLEDNYRGDKFDGKKPIDVGLSNVSVIKDGKVIIPNSNMHDLVMGFVGDDKIPIFCASLINNNILVKDGKSFKLNKEYITQIKQFGEYFVYIPCDEFHNVIKIACDDQQLSWEIGEVVYSNLSQKYAIENWTPHNIAEEFEVFFNKNLSYKWENEIRVILPSIRTISNVDHYVLNTGRFKNIKILNTEDLPNVKFTEKN